MKGQRNQNFQVSVVIPVHGRVELLEKTLTVLASQDDLRGAFEVLICDDGSKEDLRPIVEKFQKLFSHLRWLRQDRRGPAAARNLGIRESMAPSIVFLDSDILPDPGLVRILAEALKENPGWMGAEAKLESIGEEGPLWDGPSCSQGGRYHTTAIIYRREALMTVGGFDETFRLPACEDVDLAARVLTQGPIRFVPEAVARHPRRRITWKTHWHWRLHWKYVMILAKRYGFLNFPEVPAGGFPRFRVAWAAVATLPAGRFIRAWKSLGRKPKESLIALFYGLFDVFCGLWALPEILFLPVPDRVDHFLRGPSPQGKTTQNQSASILSNILK